MTTPRLQSITENFKRPALMDADRRPPKEILEHVPSPPEFRRSLLDMLEESDGGS